MDNGPRPSAWLAETTPKSNIKLKVRELALDESWFSLETRKTATITPLYRKEDLMYLANKDSDDEAFKDLETLERAKKSMIDYHVFTGPASSSGKALPEYQIYAKAVEDLQKQYSTLAQSFRELEASYKIVCEHSVKLEKALAETKHQLDQCQKSWLVAMLMRFGLMK